MTEKFDNKMWENKGWDVEGEQVHKQCMKVCFCFLFSIRAS